MCWSKARTRKQEKMLSCILKNQMIIMHMPRKKNRENCPDRWCDRICWPNCALCETVDDEECLLD